MCLWFVDCVLQSIKQQLIRALMWAFQQLLTCRNNLTLHTSHSVEAINRDRATQNKKWWGWLSTCLRHSLLRDTQTWHWHYERCYWHSHSVAYNRGVRGGTWKKKKTDICHDMKFCVWNNSEVTTNNVFVMIITKLRARATCYELRAMSHALRFVAILNY